MFFFILGLSALFIVIAFTVTEGNAKYLLSGYNTMSEADRKQVDLVAFLHYFKRFHLFLGISFLVVASALHFAVGANAAGVFVTVYPILAYVFFIVRSQRFYKALPRSKSNGAALVLVGVLVFAMAMLAWGYKETELVYSAEGIAFKGIYGERISHDEIASVYLVDQLPNITRKTNGYSLGVIKKGYFRTEEGERVKLLLNSAQRPVICITKTDGTRIYYCPKQQPSADLMDDMMTQLRQSKHQQQ